MQLYNIGSSCVGTLKDTNVALAQEERFERNCCSLDSLQMWESPKASISVWRDVKQQAGQHLFNPPNQPDPFWTYLSLCGDLDKSHSSFWSVKAIL